MITVVGPQQPKDLQASAINTTSRSDTWSRGLSPFFVGPIELYDGRVAANMENAWQFTKVYPVHVEDDQVLQLYWDWAEKGWASNRACRYPMGKGAKPVFSLWDGERLTYVEARKKIYIPCYAKAVAKTSAFQQLKEMYESFGQISLWDFDAYDHRAMGMSWRDVVNSSERKMGHAFVLAMMLDNQLEEALQ